VITCHQLLPELAEPLSQARQVIFIDASVAGTPGEIVARPVEATSEPGHSLSHQVAAASLLALARALYGRCPRATLLTVTGASFEHDADLTPVVTAALPALVEQVVRLAAAGGQESSCTSTG
jgi:hydrogenase maturation protease